MCKFIRVTLGVTWTYLYIYIYCQYNYTDYLSKK